MAKAPRQAPTSPLPRASKREWSLALIFVAAAFALYHRIEVFSGLETQIGGGADPRLIHSLCEHWLQVFRGQAQVASPHFFYPQTGTLGYTDAMLGHGVLYAMARGAGLEMFQSYNFMLVAVDALNLAATVALLRLGLRLRPTAAALGAVLFSLNSAKLAQIGHAQLQLLFPLALALWILVTLARPLRARWHAPLLGAAFGACIGLQIWSSYYNGWFFCFWLLIAGLFSLIQRETRTVVLGALRVNWLAVPVALLVLYLTLAPFARIYQPVAEQLGMRDYTEVLAMLPQPLSYFSMGDGALIWGWLPRVVPAFGALPTPWEHRMGLGLTIWLALLAATALSVRALARRNATALDRWTLLLIASAIVFLLLPLRLGDASLWRWFFDHFPRAGALRSVTRLILVGALPLTVIASLLAQRLLPWAQTRGRAWLALAALIGVFAALEQTRTLGAHVPKEERAWIAEIAAQVNPAKCSAFVVFTDSAGPASEIDLQTMAMLAAMQTGVPTLNGYSGKYPYGWDLEKMRAPGYTDRIREWRMRTELRTPVCGARVK